MKKIIVFLCVMSGCVFALVAAADEDMLLEGESLNVYESREAGFNCAQELQRAAVLDFSIHEKGLNAFSLGNATLFQRSKISRTQKDLFMVKRKIVNKVLAGKDFLFIEEVAQRPQDGHSVFSVELLNKDGLCVHCFSNKRVKKVQNNFALLDDTWKAELFVFAGPLMRIVAECDDFLISNRFLVTCKKNKLELLDVITCGKLDSITLNFRHMELFDSNVLVCQRNGKKYIFDLSSRSKFDLLQIVDIDLRHNTQSLKGQGVEFECFDRIELGPSKYLLTICKGMTDEGVFSGNQICIRMPDGQEQVQQEFLEMRDIATLEVKTKVMLPQDNHLSHCVYLDKYAFLFLSHHNQQQPFPLLFNRQGRMRLLAVNLDTFEDHERLDANIAIKESPRKKFLIVEKKTPPIAVRIYDSNLYLLQEFPRFNPNMDEYYFLKSATINEDDTLLSIIDSHTGQTFVYSMEDLTKPVAKCLAPFARFEGDFLVSTYLDQRRFPGYDFNTSKVFSLKCLKDLDLSKLEKPITLRELILQPTK